MPQKYRIGDIIKIGLNDNKHTYGRLFNDASIGIFNILTNLEFNIFELEKSEIFFYSGVFDTAIASGEWPIIGNLPFESEAASWPPPTYIQDVIDPKKYRIYHRGQMKQSSREETLNLERQVMRKPDELISIINIRFG